jgi:hypothetical protein
VRVLSNTLTAAPSLLKSSDPFDSSRKKLLPLPKHAGFPNVFNEELCPEWRGAAYETHKNKVD